LKFSASLEQEQNASSIRTNGMLEENADGPIEITAFNSHLDGRKTRIFMHSSDGNAGTDHGLVPEALTVTPKV
jgi:hypothetical protein